MATAVNLIFSAILRIPPEKKNSWIPFYANWKWKGEN
jgi:hypothetical protein